MNSKKVIRSIMAALLACTMLCTLAACTSTLSGTYVSKEGLIEQRLIFKDDNKVAVSAFGVDIEGEYRIEDGKITVTYDLGGGVLDLQYDWTKSFKKSGKSIFVDGIEFVKEK